MRFTIKMTIRPGKAEAFRQVVGQIAAMVRESDPGTLVYDYYLLPDGVAVLAHEHYSSSESFLAHVANTGHLYGPLAETAEFGETLIAGDPSPEIRARFAAGNGHAAPAIYGPL